MSTFKFACRVGTTNPDVALGIKILIDDQTLFDSDHVTETVNVTADVSDEDGVDRVLRIELRGKNDSHTKIDTDGKILADTCILVDNFEFEDLDVTSVVNSVARYTHDTNGHDTLKEHAFYGELGCNGTVKMKFSTPVYIWLLENM